MIHPHGTQIMPIQSLHKLPVQPSKLPPVVAKQPRRRSWFWWKVSAALLVVIISFIGLVGYRLLAAVNTTTNENKKVSVLTQLGHLVGNRDAMLKGEAEDRINILLLGIGGEGHEGALLTDTIILASVKPSTGQVSMLSIPRDLAVDLPQYGIRKINNANAFGKQINYVGGGEQLTVDVVSKITGQTIQYFGRIDFAGFKKIVDDLGGININVANAFTDYEYPNNNFGYQTITFKTGGQKMNGDLALKFARSRHGNNGEGSDFARSRRQQLILEGIRGKAFSLGTVINPVKIGSVLSSLGSHTRTNMEVWELLRLVRMVKSASGDAITNRVLDTGTDGPLKNTTGIDGAYLLEPKAGFQNFTAVKAIAAGIFDHAAIQQDAAEIVIVDASGVAGTGKKIADILETIGYAKPTVDASKPKNPLTTTLVIDQTGGMNPATFRTLRSYFGLYNQRTELTPLDIEGFLNVNGISNNNINAAANANLAPSTADAEIVIILGRDVTTAQLAKVKLSPST